MAAEWMMKDDHEQIDQDRAELALLRAELALLRAELARVTRERDGAVAIAAGDYSQSRPERRADGIARIIKCMGRGIEPLADGEPDVRFADVAAALAEHDRRAAE